MRWEWRGISKVIPFPLANDRPLKKRRVPVTKLSPRPFSNCVISQHSRLHSLELWEKKEEEGWKSFPSPRRWGGSTQTTLHKEPRATKRTQVAPDITRFSVCVGVCVESLMFPHSILLFFLKKQFQSLSTCSCAPQSARCSWRTTAYKHHDLRLFFFSIHFTGTLETFFEGKNTTKQK